MDWVFGRMLSRAKRSGRLRLQRRVTPSQPWIVWTTFHVPWLILKLSGRNPLHSVCAICGRSRFVVTRVNRFGDMTLSQAGVYAMNKAHRHPGLHTFPRDWEVPIDVDVIPRASAEAGMFGRQVIQTMEEAGRL